MSDGVNCYLLCYVLNISISAQFSVQIVCRLSYLPFNNQVGAKVAFIHCRTCKVQIEYRASHIVLVWAALCLTMTLLSNDQTQLLGQIPAVMRKSSALK